MPTGVYERTTKHDKAISRGLKRAMQTNRLFRRKSIRQLRKIQRSNVGKKWPKSFGKKISKSLKKYFSNPRNIKKHSLRTKKLWAKESFRRKVIKGQNTPEANRGRIKAIKKTNKILWNDPNFVARITKARKTSRRVKTGTFGPSKIHLSIFRYLCRKGIRGLRIEYQIPPYLIDIAIPKKKVAIEVDGKFWHNNKKKEKRRDKFLRHLGWKVVHVPASKKQGRILFEMLKTGGAT